MMRESTGTASIDRIDDRAHGIVVCDACGTGMSIERVGAAVSWRGVWLCDACWQSLSPEEIDLLTREVALRGVPFS